MTRSTEMASCQAGTCFFNLCSLSWASATAVSIACTVYTRLFEETRQNGGSGREIYSGLFRAERELLSSGMFTFLYYLRAWI
jgi:hypothetical protein